MSRNYRDMFANRCIAETLADNEARAYFALATGFAIEPDAETVSRRARYERRKRARG